MDPDGRLRKTPRQARSRSTVEAILEAAERVLRSEGYRAASTNRMARVAGFSVGSLYQYFDDKQAVVGALLDQALRAEAERIAQALDGLAKLGRARLAIGLVRAVFAERRSKAHLLRILDAHGPSSVSRRAAAPRAAGAGRRARGSAASLRRRAAGGCVPRRASTKGSRWRRASYTRSSYALAVDAPEHLADEPSRCAPSPHSRRRGIGVAEPSAARGRAARGLAARQRRRLRRRRRARAPHPRDALALVRGAGFLPAALEPSVFVVAAIGEVVASCVSSRRRACRSRAPTRPRCACSRPACPSPGSGARGRVRTCTAEARRF